MKPLAILIHIFFRGIVAYRNWQGVVIETLASACGFAMLRGVIIESGAHARLRRAQCPAYRPAAARG
jgi:hypothetical protein